MKKFKDSNQNWFKGEIAAEETQPVVFVLLGFFLQKQNSNLVTNHGAAVQLHRHCGSFLKAGLLPGAAELWP